MPARHASFAGEFAVVFLAHVAETAAASRWTDSKRRAQAGGRIAKGILPCNVLPQGCPDDCCHRGRCLLGPDIAFHRCGQVIGYSDGSALHSTHRSTKRREERHPCRLHDPNPPPPRPRQRPRPLQRQRQSPSMARNGGKNCARSIVNSRQPDGPCRRSSTKCERIGSKNCNTGTLFFNVRTDRAFLRATPQHHLLQPAGPRPSARRRG